MYTEVCEQNMESEIGDRGREKAMAGKNRVPTMAYGTGDQLQSEENGQDM